MNLHKFTPLYLCRYCPDVWRDAKIDPFDWNRETLMRATKELWDEYYKVQMETAFGKDYKSGMINDRVATARDKYRHFLHFWWMDIDTDANSQLRFLGNSMQLQHSPEEELLKRGYITPNMERDNYTVSRLGDPDVAAKKQKELTSTQKGRIPRNAAAAESDDTGDSPSPDETPRPRAAQQAPKEKGTARPGVIATLITLLRSASKKAPMTKEQLLAGMVKAFPDRQPQAMKSTISSQVPNAMLKEKGLQCLTDGKGGWWLPKE